MLYFTSESVIFVGMYEMCVLAINPCTLDQQAYVSKEHNYSAASMLGRGALVVSD